MTVKCWMFTWYQALMTPISHEENSGARTPREIERCRPPPCSQVAVSFSHFAPFWMDQLRLGNLEQPFRSCFKKACVANCHHSWCNAIPNPWCHASPTNCRSCKEHCPHSCDAIPNSSCEEHCPHSCDAIPNSSCKEHSPHSCDAMPNSHQLQK